MQSVLDFNELSTPAGHGEVLVLPLPNLLVDLPDINRRHLRTNEFRVLDVSSEDCRTFSRQSLHADQCKSLWIATGHQPEFIHPGVWAKHVVTQRLANYVRGVPVNIIVDHDAAKDTAIMVPSEQDGRYRRVHVSFAEYRPGVPWELIPPLSARQFDDLSGRVKAAYGPRYATSLMGIFFAAASQMASPADCVDQIIAGRRAIDAMFGICLIETRARKVWGGPFLAQMLLDAERFFTCYNEALREYRQQLNIKGNLHPIPDLVRQGDRLELPIWAVRSDGPRQRVFIARHADRIDLFAERDPIGTLSVTDLQHWQTAGEALTTGVSAGLRPRALTLTLWARLFLADVFIHGIGGAKYDRITDILIRKYFNIDPPAISCVSATLRLDLPTPAVSHGDLHDLSRRLRDLRHNPHRYLPSVPQVESLLAAKTGLVARSDYLREHEPEGRFERREVFDRIHEINRQMLLVDPNMAADLEQRHRDVAGTLAQSAIARSREYYIGLFRRQDLQFLCDMLPTF